MPRVFYATFEIEIPDELEVTDAEVIEEISGQQPRIFVLGNTLNVCCTDVLTMEEIQELDKLRTRQAIQVLEEIRDR